MARDFKSAAAKHAWKFSPYFVRVYPKWFHLLLDYKLIGKPEEWHAIQESFEELPATEYRLLRDGICFMVVQKSEDFERTLIYSEHHRSFASDINFEEAMKPIKLENEIDRTLQIEGYVRFFVRSGLDGYELGIKVPDWWWEEVGASCPSPMEEDKDYATGQVKLTLAIISYREFDLYWDPVEWSSSFYKKTTKQIEARRDAQREKLGWEAKEHPDIPELRIDWPDSIKHKYFKVEHGTI